VYWDKPTKRAKFGDFMDQLEARGFVSAYHSHHRSERGAEPHPTLWWMKNTDTTYHIDYTFVSRPDVVDGVTMGTHADWIAHSDHGPMTVDLRVGPHGPHQELAANPVVERRDDGKELTSIDDSRLHEPSHPPMREEQTNLVHIPIDPGTLPDMSCGVNGQPFVQMFSPTYFTAQWIGGVVVEIRIWGPRVPPGWFARQARTRPPLEENPRSRGGRLRRPADLGG